MACSTSDNVKVEDEWFEEELTSEATISKNDSTIDTSSSSTETSFTLPSEILQSLDSTFSLGSQEFYLNNCGTKRLVVGITCPVMPNLKVVFKLHDLKNSWSIEFTKKSWDSIVNCEQEISDCLYNEIEGDIFNNIHLRVATQILYNRSCVQFFDISEMHVALASDTFERMMSLRGEIETIYTELQKKVKDVAKRIKLFMDMSFFMLFKSNNIDSRHNYNWLMLMMDKNSEFLELSNSIAETWKKLGKWIEGEQPTDT